MLAGVAVGAYADLDAAAAALVQPAARHEPRPETAAALEAARTRWRAADDRDART
jgi:sugar (pentulose or hexulose) kinase